MGKLHHYDIEPHTVISKIDSHHQCENKHKNTQTKIKKIKRLKTEFKEPIGYSPKYYLMN